MSEIARIATMPTAPPAPPDLSRRYLRPDPCGVAGCEWCGRTLLPAQTAALWQLATGGGLFGAIGVGAGKTAIVCLAGRAAGAQYVVALTKRKLLPALRATYEALERHTTAKLPPMQTMTYGELSHANGTATLDRIVRDCKARGQRLLIAADEAHMLAAPTSARTKRFLRVFDAAPDTVFAGVSGTMADHQIKQFAHLAELACRHHSPVPRPSVGGDALDAFGACLDADGRPSAGDFAALGPFWNRWAPTPGGQYVLHGKERAAWARAAFNKRLVTTPGVVCTTEASVGASLVVRRLREPAPCPEVAELLRQLEDDGVDPRGDVMPSSDDLWRVARHLSVGFYMAWVWPGGVKDEEWIDARRGWHRALRDELEEHSREGYDSPFLVTAETLRRIARGESSPLIRAWRAWDVVRHRPEPPSVVRWVDTSLVEHAVARLRASRQPGILWYESQAVEAALRLLGVDVFGRGRPAPDGVTKGWPIAASWRVHAEGANLQHGWAHNIVLEPPAAGKVWEQLIGRTHRQGQRRDEVTVDVYTHAAAFRHALAQGQRRAEFVEGTLGNRLRLNLATYVDEDGEED